MEVKHARVDSSEQAEDSCDCAFVDITYRMLQFIPTSVDWSYDNLRVSSAEESHEKMLPYHAGSYPTRVDDTLQ